MKFKRAPALAVLAIGLLAATAIAVFSPSAAARVTLTHVHGLAYGTDGERIYIPSHDGLAIYRDGQWSKAPGPQHDYMGFHGTRSAFYTSGHPAPGSGLVNPFGLMKSEDGGNTWRKLGMQGESDFHVLAAGYENNAVYVSNPAPNSRMRSSGIHFTLNDGFNWQRAQAKGLAGDIRGLAVHPTDAKRVAAATEVGVYLSDDAGATFEPVLAQGQGTMVFFDLDGKHLWAGTYDGRPALTRIEFGSRKTTAVALPELARDAVAYVAQNPKRADEYAITTFERDVYLSPDAGKTWTAIARKGRTLEPSEMVAK